MLPVKYKLYEGKAKVIFTTNDHQLVIQHFKDDITAFNNKRKDTMLGKGIINNYISAFLMTNLNAINLKTHFIKLLNDREQLVRRVDTIPLEVVVRNIACGSFCQRFPINEGKELQSPIVEFFYKDDLLSDPIINEEKILTDHIISSLELEEIKTLSIMVNDELKKIFYNIGIKLVDFKLEFGKIHLDNKKTLILADEITPDNCRLWCVKTNERLDKDIYRQNLGNVIEAYKKVAQRLSITIPKF